MRRAQSILRWDRRPSLWSHAFLLVGGGESREVALHSRAGRFPEPADNAITRRRRSRTTRTRGADPNVALLSVRMDAEEAARVVARATENPNLERLRYDLFETLGFWQAFLWTRGTPNPLEQGVPNHSSSMVEYCFEEIQLDLTPGANDRNSAPEHLWNGARWWKRRLRRVRPPDRRPLRDPRPQLRGARARGALMEVIRRPPDSKRGGRVVHGRGLDRRDLARPAREAPERPLRTGRPDGVARASVRPGDPCHRGAGLFQVRGEPLQPLRAGDTVRFEANEVHWHGAGPSTFMTHLAMQEVADDGTDATWGPHVIDEEYLPD